VFIHLALALSLNLLWLSAIDRWALSLSDFSLHFSGEVELHWVLAQGVLICASVLLLELLTRLEEACEFGGQRMNSILSPRARWSCRALPWTLFGVLGYLLGVEISAGDWIQAQSYAPTLKWIGMGAFALGGVGLYGLAHLRSASEATPRLWPVGRGSRVAFITLLSASLFFCLCDTLLFPGLYQALHDALYLLSVLTATIAFSYRLIEGRARSTLIAVALGLIGWGSAHALIHLPDVQVAQLSSTSPRANMLMRHAPAPTRFGDLTQALEAVNLNTPLPEVTPTPTQTPPYNVLMIVVDTLRHDALPPGFHPQSVGRERDTPFLSQWLSSTYRFTNAYAQATRTKVSMPSTFHSLEVYERSGEGVRSLPEEIKALGYTTLAVIPEYFMWPIKNGAHHLITPFEHIFAYNKRRQNTLPKLWKKALKSVDNTPFFAWVHFYMMHHPYYSAKGPTSSKHGEVIDRYRLALSNLDRQLEEVIADLRARDLEENTIILICSDHGENLNENHLTGHGRSVFEEESHVPLIVSIPGASGGLRQQVVSNIDIMPTILDLVGAGGLAPTRGRSLGPLLSDETAEWPYSYLISNGSTFTLGLVDQERQKLIISRSRNKRQRFNLAKDPTEDRNIYGRSPQVDHALTQSLIYLHPQLGISKSASLKRAQLKTLSQQLISLFERAQRLSYEDLRFVLRVLGLTRSRLAGVAALDYAKRVDSEAVQLQVARALTSINPKAAQQRLLETLKRSEETPSLQRMLLKRMVSLKTPRFSPVWVFKHVQQSVKRDDPSKTPLDEGQLDRAIAWLELTENWSKTSSKWAQFILDLLRRDRASESSLASKEDRLSSVLLGNLLTLTVKKTSDKEKMKQANALLLDLLKTSASMISASSLAISVSAVDAVADVYKSIRQLKKRRPRGKAVSEVVHSIAKELKALIKDPKRPIYLRDRSLYALVELIGSKATMTLVKASRTSQLMMTTVKLLAKVGTKRAIPPLRKMKTRVRSVYARKQMARAIKLIRKRGRSKR
jgi:arylsulfatase A-like enzyme